MPDGLNAMDQETGLDEHMHFRMRMMFSEDDMSLDSNNSFPCCSISTSPDLPLVLYQIHVQFISKIVKIIKFAKYIIPIRLVSLVVEILVVI